MEKQICLPLDENLKRIVSKSLQIYRDKLQRADRKMNKVLYHTIVDEELSWIDQLLLEIEKKWTGKTIIDIQQLPTFAHVRQILEKLKQHPTLVGKGKTEQGQLVEVTFHKADRRFEIFIDGIWMCKAKKIDWTAHVLMSILG